MYTFLNIKSSSSIFCKHFKTYSTYKICPPQISMFYFVCDLNLELHNMLHNIENKQVFFTPNFFKRVFFKGGKEVVKWNLI